MTQRHQAREAALRILYSCIIGGVPAGQAIELFFQEHDPEAAEPVRAFAARLVEGSLADGAALDQLIGEHSHNWRLERIAVIDRLILRMAIWELRHEPDTPPAVALDEALELARSYSGEESVAFVNGVLDAVRKTLEKPGP